MYRPTTVATSLLAVLAVLWATMPTLAVGEPETAPTVMVKLANGSWEPRTLEGTLEEQLDEALDEPGVVEASPVMVYEMFDHSNPPSDPDYPNQWHLHRTEAGRAWRHGDGSGVVVAVIDSGVANVSDLACHTYVSPYDFVTNKPGVPPDSDGHGTFVTAVVAECTDNAVQGAGTAPGVSIMPLRIFDDDANATTVELQKAMQWARTHGADVVNLSLGFPCNTPYPQCRDAAIDAEIGALVSAGVVVVAASGNDGGPFLAYPANHPQVVGVGASNPNGTKAAYSNTGSGLDLVAPVGNGISHLGVPNSAGVSGTSFASPQVAGAVALLLSSGAPSGNQAVSALKASARDIAPTGYDTATGHGDLRIREALAWGGLGLTPPIADASFFASGDFTGDGRTDTLTYDGAFGRWWVLTSTGSALEAKQWARFSTVSGWSARLIGDFNGDGRDDLANFHPSNGSWWVSRSTGAAFASSIWTQYSTTSGWGPQLVGDFNGDGRDDIANYYAGNGTWWVSRSTGSSFSTSLWATFSTRTGWKTHIVGDFNGDGRDDIASYYPGNGTWWVSRSTGTGFSTSLWATFSTKTGWARQLVGDFNGDGRDDIANYYPGNGTWWVSRSTGSSFSTSLWATFSTKTGWSPQLVGDFNGDGRDDIANYFGGNRTWWISRSTGTAFATGRWATISGWTTAGALVGDYNGDGRDDLADAGATGVWWVGRSTGTSLAGSFWYP